MSENRAEELLAKDASAIEALADGTMMSVMLRKEDGSHEKVTVKVRKVPMRLMFLLINAWSKEAEEIAVYCDRPLGWVNQLADESWDAVMEEGRRLNFSRFERSFARQQQAIAAMKLSPETTELVARTVGKVLESRT